MTVRAALAVALVACGSTSSVTPDGGPPDAALPPPVGSFPAGFQWGTAISPYQVEGGLHGDDWYRWETLCSGWPRRSTTGSTSAAITTGR